MSQNVGIELMLLCFNFISTILCCWFSQSAKKNKTFSFSSLCLSCSFVWPVVRNKVTIAFWSNTETQSVEFLLVKKTNEINVCWVIILLMLVSFSFHDITVIKIYPLVCPVLSLRLSASEPLTFLFLLVLTMSEEWKWNFIFRWIEIVRKLLRAMANHNYDVLTERLEVIKLFLHQATTLVSPE